MVLRALFFFDLSVFFLLPVEVALVECFTGSGSEGAFCFDSGLSLTPEFLSQGCFKAKVNSILFVGYTISKEFMKSLAFWLNFFQKLLVVSNYPFLVF